MTEEQNVSSNIDTSVDEAPVTESPQEPVNDTVVTESAPQEPVKQEKVFNERQMKVISDSVRKDVERNTEARIRAEYEAKFNGQQEQEPAPSEQPESNIDGMTREQLYDDFRQRQYQEQQHANTQNVANELLTKVQSAGLGDKIESSGIGQLPVNHPLIPFLNSLDNVEDVINDFDANPVKIANLLAVTHLNPEKGFKELHAISSSLKRNKEALAKEQAPEPLNQLKPSSYGLGDGVASIATKRRNPAFKF